MEFLQVGVLACSCLLLEVLNPLFGRMMNDIQEMTDSKEKLKKDMCTLIRENERWCMPEEFIFERVLKHL